MDKNKRTFVNVLAQYIRTIINTCLSLYATRLVLNALGKSDYGVFMVVGGVVAMLGFFTNALVITTQRYLSYYQGKDDKSEVKSFFANSLVLHLILGVLIVVVLWLLWPLLIDHVLNINPGRIDAAGKVYIFTLLTLFLSFMVAPFRGLFIARENIVTISIIDVCDGILKLILVLYLIVWDVDKLIVYSMLLSGIMLLNLIFFSLCAKIKYEECVLFPKANEIKWSIMARLFSFAGWTTYSTACIIGRNQGVAVIFNHFFGTLINAAYGIAVQVGGTVQFVAQSILNAMSPRVVKAEGQGDRKEMLKLAGTTSKFAFLLLSMAAIPLIFEMPYILETWLGEGKVPQHAVTFCRFVLIAAVCDQMTVGLGVANQAMGKIRNYSLLINTVKVLTLPCLWIAIKFGMPVELTMWIYLAFEVICMCLRLVYLNRVAKLNVREYIGDVLVKLVVPTITLLVVGYVMVYFFHFHLRFILTMIVSVLIDAFVIIFFALDKNERAMLLSFIKRGKK